MVHIDNKIRFIVVYILVKVSFLIKHLTDLEIEGMVLSNNKSYQSTRIVVKVVLPREICSHSSIVVH